MCIYVHTHTEHFYKALFQPLRAAEGNDKELTAGFLDQPEGGFTGALTVQLRPSLGASQVWRTVGICWD